MSVVIDPVRRNNALFRLVILLACVACPAIRVEALDANRSLSQCMQRIWQVQQGLPQATIFSIRQTRDGYLWLGSPTGLIRFDGLRFTMVDETAGASLENLWVQDVFEDAEHQLWLATDRAGLLRLRGGVATQYTHAMGLPSDDVRCSRVTRDGAVWIATADGLARLAKPIVPSLDTPAEIEPPSAAASFEVYRTEQGLAANSVRALCEAADGSLWIGGDGNQLSVWNDGRFNTVSLDSLPRHGSVQALLAARDGAIWVGTSSGLLRLKDGEKQIITTEEGLAHDFVLCLAEGRGETLWVGTKEGFSRLQPADAASKLAGGGPKPFEIESFRARDGLSQSTVYALCEDREGSLWVGTKHGLNQFFDRRTLLYGTREGLPSNEAGPVLQDAAGSLWVGTLDAGLGRFDGRRFTALSSKEGLASDTIFTLADGHQGELWVGTDKGLNRLHVEPRGKTDAAAKIGMSKTYTTSDGLPADTVWCLCRDRGGELWAGTAAGIAVLRGDRFERPEGAPESLGVSVRALVARRDGSLLAAGEDGGLYRCADDRFQPLEAPGMAHREFDAFYEDADGLLWIGAVGSGLTLLDHDKFVNFTTRDGLFDDDVFGIVADDQDHLWMACSKGIFFVARADLLKFAAGKLKRLTCTPFSPTDALRTIECKGGIQPALCHAGDGRVWFSTTRGMIVIDPNRLQRDVPAAPVLVEEVIVNGKSEQPDQVRRLPPGETNLSFRYAALSFVTPSRITFRYKLEGFDKDWIEAGSRREAFYTNLPPGNYRFRVGARAVTAGPVNEAASPVTFTLEPHFYQNPWFLPLCVAAGGLAVWAAYRLRVRRIREQLQVVVAERSRIARELHDTLMQGFSGVTMEMQALSVRLSASRERDTLQEIIHDAGICLQEARRSVAGLRSAPNGDPGLAGAIAEAARHLTETHDVRLKLKLQGNPQGLGPDVQYNLLRILQEAVTNAVKHSGAGTVEVGLDCTQQRLLVTISDDGVGFLLAEGNGSQPGHYGLIGMRERAAQIGGELQLQSEPGHGTKVAFTLPLGQTSVPASSAKSPQRMM